MRSELCVRVIRVFPDRIPPARPDLAGAVRFGGEGVPGSERRGGAPAATRTPRGRSRRGGSSWMRRRPEEEATRARVIKRTKERQRGRRERGPVRAGFVFQSNERAHALLRVNTKISKTQLFFQKVIKKNKMELIS
jgi:hypothetical protein